MKKTYIFSFILGSVLFTSSVYANNSIPPPVVSIGVGNGNTPANTGPVHDGIFHGSIPVFATVSDTDLDNYHFRVVKDGGSQGHTCIVSNSLFTPENQGYASTTLNKDTCGFNFNQSVYVSSVGGFSNTLIATLNTNDLIAFGGEGDYWLIIGGLDTPGSRTAPNYLDDPKVKVTITNTTTTSSTASQGGDNTADTGGGGSGRSGDFRGSRGQVLGESCGLYIDKFIRSGRANDPEQVMKLQAFLNKWMGANLPITGFYGPLTLGAVNAFQEKHAAVILTPWGLTDPTGIVYQTTQHWINLLECPELPLPFPTLIAWSKNPNVPHELLVIVTTPSPQTSTPPKDIDGSSNIEVDGASSGGFFKFLKNLFGR